MHNATHVHLASRLHQSGCLSLVLPIPSCLHLCPYQLGSINAYPGMTHKLPTSRRCYLPPSIDKTRLARRTRLKTKPFLNQSQLDYLIHCQILITYIHTGRIKHTPLSLSNRDKRHKRRHPPSRPAQQAANRSPSKHRTHAAPPHPFLLFLKCKHVRGPQCC